MMNRFGFGSPLVLALVFLFGLMAPFAAALMNRYGLRNVTLSALLIVACGPTSRRCGRTGGWPRC